MEYLRKECEIARGLPGITARIVPWPNVVWLVIFPSRPRAGELVLVRAVILQRQPAKPPAGLHLPKSQPDQLLP